MDGGLTAVGAGLGGAAGRPAAETVRPMPRPGMPRESALAMPVQDLRRPDRSAARRLRPKPAVVGRRIVAFGAAALLAGYAITEMHAVLKLGGLTPIEALVLVLFSLNFTWIAFAFVTASIGFVLILARRGRLRRRRPVPLAGRTAVLMPTYNESPDRVFAAIEAMATGIARAGEGRSFDWFVLSDTTDPEIALAEEAALVAIRGRVGGTAEIYYRRRRMNHARKAGNIADFCRRWGGAYDYMLVLDADSLMTPATIIELARRIEADPAAGLIQTVPRLAGGRTLLARAQQFAGWVYGPVGATGLAWWAGQEGNYWGHNAIARTAAFAGAAGLPTLSGRPPFGGHILSHDFVEAALIRRAGYAVIVADDLDGSYEESPPSLIDLAIRDRRWCQGNLQHAKVIGARGLHWVSRLHLLTGIFSYLSSPLWLAMILAGMGLSLQANFSRPDYFPEAFGIFPTWPIQDAERALQLFLVTMAILFGPKAMGLVAFALSGRNAAKPRRLLSSFFVELLFSALVAPVMMLVQCKVVAAILSGRDAGWKPQRRDDGRLSWREVFRFHAGHMLFGLVLAILAWWDSAAMLAWLAPALAGLLIAAPLSALSGSAEAGRVLRRSGLLVTPAEIVKPWIQRQAEDLRPVYLRAVANAPDLRRVAADPQLRRQHLALVDPPPARPRGQIEAVEALAAARIGEAGSLAEAIAFLSPAERSTVIATPTLFERLAALPAH